MEDIVREYLKNNRQEMKKLKNENTKEKKHLTYNENQEGHRERKRHKEQRK